MSDSSGSGISDHHGDVSDDEGSVAGSVAASHASDMPDTPISKKRARPKQIQGKAWIYHGIITVDAALLHTASENDDDCPFSSLKALLLALWTSIYLQLEPKIKKLILHLAFFCNLASLMACSRDEKDSSKVQIHIRAFLRCNNTSVTALARLLPLSPDLLSTIHSAKLLPFNLWGDFLSGSWDRCQGGLSGHALYKQCVQTESDNNWMSMLEINELGVIGKAIQKQGAKKKVCCSSYEFGFSCANRIIVMMNRIQEWFAMFMLLMQML